VLKFAQVDQQQKLKYWSIAIIALLLMLYTIARATMMAFTTDEAFSYLVYVNRNVFYLREFNDMDANFHVLNIWGMNICNYLFGNSEFSLRLPNLLAHVLWLYFTAKFALRAPSVISAVAVFSVLNVHPYLLDFFSVARGYGLSFGFMAGALWWLVRFAEERAQSQKTLALTIVFSGLAVWSSFVTLHVFCAIAGVCGLLILFYHTKERTVAQRVKQLTVQIVFSALMLAVALPIIIGMNEANALTWGTDSFWDGTLRGILGLFGYNPRGEIVITDKASTPVLALLFCVLGAIGAGAWYNQRSGKERTVLLIIFTVTALSVLSVVLQHFILGKPYPLTRTGLFLFVLFLFCLALALQTMARKKIRNGLSAALIAGLLAGYAPDYNLHVTAEWSFCGDIKNAIALLEKEKGTLPSEIVQPTVGVDLELVNVMRYYQERNNLNWFLLNWRVPGLADPPSDLYISTRSMRATLPHGDTLGYFAATDLLVLRHDFSNGKKELYRKTEPGITHQLRYQGDPVWLAECRTDSMMAAYRLNVRAQVNHPADTSMLHLIVECYRNDTISSYHVEEFAPLPVRAFQMKYGRTFIVPPASDWIRVFMLSAYPAAGTIRVSDLDVSVWAYPENKARNGD
jgi:hypothetical protein